jgi:O-antigen/teichoic acid export membrane protein
MGVQLVLYAFEAAWWPYAYARAQKPGHGEQFARIFAIVTTGTLAIAVVIGMFAREALLIITTAEFVPAYPYVGLLALALVVHGGYGIISIGVQLGERTRHMAWTSGIAATVNVALTLLLIPSLGILGAAIATLAGYVASTILLYVVAQRGYPIPYRFDTVAIGIGLGFALLAAGQLLDGSVRGATWVPMITAAKAGVACAALIIAALLVRSRKGLTSAFWVDPS